MKKLLILLSFLIASVLAYSQGVKISAMPTWTTSLDSTWFPIIYNNGTNWINYRAQGYVIIAGVNERIDSIINNWPAGGGARFAVSGEDDLSNETRSFDANNNFFGITNLGTATSSNILYYNAITGEITWGAISYKRFGVSGEDDDAAQNRSFDITGFTFGITGLATATTSNVLYYNSGTGEITYGAAPSGGGGSGIQSIEGNNGVTVLTDSIVQLGATNNSGVAFTGNRWINTSTNVLTIRGSSLLWPLQVENTGNAYAASFTTNAAGAIRAQNLYGDVSTIRSVVDVVRAGSGTSTAGVGGGIDTYVWIDNTNGSTYAGTTYFTLTNTTYATRSSDFGIKVVSNTATITPVLVKASGNIELQAAGKAYGLKSPNGTTYYIVVDNSGNLSTTTTAP